MEPFYFYTIYYHKMLSLFIKGLDLFVMGTLSLYLSAQGTATNDNCSALIPVTDYKLASIQASILKKFL